MKPKLVFVKLIVFIFVANFLLPASAWPTDNKIDKSAKPNQSIVLFKLFLYDPSSGCRQLPAPQATAEGAILGKVSTRVGKQKLPPSLQACGKDFEAEYVEWVYAAGPQSGIDKFKIYYHDGQSLIPINVSISINGHSLSENNIETKIISNENKMPSTKTTIISPNPIFDKMKFGTSITYNYENNITQSKGKLIFAVSEKTDKEFVSVVGDSHIVYNPLFERIKSGNWNRNGRSCDGIIYPFEINKKINFSYTGIYQKDDIKQTRQFNCQRIITGIKTITYQGSPTQGWAIENTERSVRPDGGQSVFQFNGTFSEEMGVWLEVFINERVDNRLITSIEWKLFNVFTPESQYQIRTTMCSGNCETASENQKASVIDPKKYKNKFECEQRVEEFKKNNQPVPVPTSFLYACVEAH